MERQLLDMKWKRACFFIGRNGEREACIYGRRQQQQSLRGKERDWSWDFLLIVQPKLVNVIVVCWNMNTSMGGG